MKKSNFLLTNKINNLKLITFLCFLYIVFLSSVSYALTLPELFDSEQIQNDATEIYKNYTWEVAHHEEFEDEGEALDLGYLLSYGAGLYEGLPSWIVHGSKFDPSLSNKNEDIKQFMKSGRTCIVNQLMIILEIYRYPHATNDNEAYKDTFTNAHEDLKQLGNIFINNKILNCSVNDFMKECSNAISIIYNKIEKDGLEYMYKFIDDGDGYYNSIFMITFPKYKLSRIIYKGEHYVTPQTVWDWHGTCKVSDNKAIICNSTKDEKPNFTFKLIINKHNLGFIDENNSFKKYLDETIGVMNIYIPKKFNLNYKKNS